MRVGFGYDVHRLVEGRRLILGGVTIPFEKGLDGHSDADVLLHAIADALLGAAALGDIGAHFPDTDAAWKGADSTVLLARVGTSVHAQGYAIGNIDATVVLERPKLRPYIYAMRQIIARTLALNVTQVSVKATTSEGMGFVGTGEGAAAYATCALHPTETPEAA
ncbi:2-C-methyl-D-erythritol 2,4-cyclodiphosphate synthase [Salisaeta longa]|uniref:2-C-methyl-D-erythritol 2,4-cyclodiphosphate synthase n=1 Tax=Salisaeta longa TaxID=503170 RepID=UPI0003B65DCA|nr:2-C-methyl-D-erythritol 2,4-cyclodiphosphate synthase [Salisaeta longa]